jgi:hypothetical protein
MVRSRKLDSFARILAVQDVWGGQLESNGRLANCSPASVIRRSTCARRTWRSRSWWTLRCRAAAVRVLYRRRARRRGREGAGRRRRRGRPFTWWSVSSAGSPARAARRRLRHPERPGHARRRRAHDRAAETDRAPGTGARYRMRILFIGDIVGRPGRDLVRLGLRPLVDHHAVDLVIANGENSGGGFGITRRSATTCSSAASTC